MYSIDEHCVESAISAANNGRWYCPVASVTISQLGVVDTSSQPMTGHGLVLISLSTKFYWLNVSRFCAIFARWWAGTIVPCVESAVCRIGSGVCIFFARFPHQENQFCVPSGLKNQLIFLLKSRQVQYAVGLLVCCHTVEGSLRQRSTRNSDTYELVILHVSQRRTFSIKLVSFWEGSVSR